MAAHSTPVLGVVIRPAEVRDLEVLRLLVQRTLSSPEIRGIPPERIGPMQEAIATDMARMTSTGWTLVAEAGGVIRGTGSLEGDRVKMMFVDPDWQGRGIGARLLLELLRIASQTGQPGVMLFSSLNAEGFYTHMGFTKVRDNVWEGERTIVMKKRL